MKPINISTIAHHALIFITAALALLAVGIGSSRSAEQQSDFNYTVVFSDAQGVSHFRDEHTAWNGPSLATKSIRFRQIPAGARRDWHNERPGAGASKQWVIIMSGVVDYVTSDGVRRTFGPGSVLLITDISGRGHQNFIGNQEVLFATVPVPD